MNEASKRPEFGVRDRPAGDLAAYGCAIGLVALGTAAAWLSRGALAAPDIVLLYLVGIAIVAVLFGRGPTLVASALSVAAYNFFFVPPLFTLAVRDPRHLLTFATMLAVSLFIGGLMLRIRRQELEAREREVRTSSLYALSGELGGVTDERQAAGVLAKHVALVFQGAAAVVMEQPLEPAVVAAAGGEIPFGETERTRAQRVLDLRRPVEPNTHDPRGDRIAWFPIHAGERVLGALALAPRSDRVLDDEALRSLEAFLRQGGLAIERARLAELARTAALRARTEEMRSSLLSAVSHDLRTPLAAVMGAATALRDRSAQVPHAQQRELLEAICEEAERLDRLVGNLLDMTRVDSGALRLKREWVPLEEIIGAALSRLEGKLRDRSVQVELPHGVPFVSVDAVVFEQVFVNLLENAAKYSPAGSPIEVIASERAGAVVVEVRDRGPGLPPEGERIFEKFVRGRHQGVSGVGLGLPICRGVVEAHGGTIRAENREGGGAVFRIAIPIVGRTPSVPAEIEDDARSTEAPT